MYAWVRKESYIVIATFEGLGHPFILMALEGCKRTQPGHVVQATTEQAKR